MKVIFYCFLLSVFNPLVLTIYADKITNDTITNEEKGEIGNLTLGVNPHQHSATLKTDYDVNGSGCEKGKCPSGFTYNKRFNSCYMMIKTPMEYDQSLTVCSTYSDKARLAVLDSDTKSREIRRTIFTDYPGCADFWIGLRRYPASCQGKFKWKMTGNSLKPLIYSSWSRGQPDCWRSVEFCGEVWELTRNGFQWNDRNCDARRCGLCEIPL